MLSVVIVGCGGGGGSLPASDYFTSVAVADLDGDGLPDIAATFTHSSDAPPHSGYVAVYLQLHGHPGIFAAPTIHAVGNDPVAIAVGDLDGDDRSDIVTANAILATSGAGVSDVSVLRQNPAAPGQFLAAASYGVGTVPHDVAIGDIDGDGRPDLVAADSEGLSLLMQDVAAPDTFRSRTRVDVGTGGTTSAGASVLLQDPVTLRSFGAAAGYAIAFRSEDIAIADLDGDGRADLAVANFGSLAGLCPPDCGIVGSGVSVLLQQPASAGRFQSAQNYPTSDDFAQWVAVSDVNGDGRNDLVIAQANGIFVRLQDPARPGQFQAATPVGR